MTQPAILPKSLSTPSSMDEDCSTVISNQDASAKQRKIRKGTRSCWECKRRKIRCIFPSPSDAVCSGCQRRRVPCVGQDMPEALSPAKRGNRYLGDRLARVEDVMKDLLAGKDVDAPSHHETEPHQDRHTAHVKAGTKGTYSLTPSSVRAPPTPEESPADYTSHPSFLASPAASSHVESEPSVLHPMLSAFQSVDDAKILLKETPRSTRYIDLLNTQPHGKLTTEGLGAPYTPGELPGPETHSVLVAKCLLVNAITLQSPCTFPGLSQPPAVLARRLATAATTWLMTAADVQGSVESLVCVMLEAVYEINCGNLRQAWSVYRRAMTIAQMMGIHRLPLPPLKRIDPTLDIDPGFLWFRVVHMDRYLSLLLGLPQGTRDKSMGDISRLGQEPPLGRFERELTVVASAILERNEYSFSIADIATTQSIDSELLRISKSMPASFWRPASFQNVSLGSPENLLETIRLSAQVYYYGLLIQLHLPFMMHGRSNNSEHEYSKITCINASREIITRFIAHRSFNPKSSCSRPVDFFALSAAMTLLLAHLDAHQQSRPTNIFAHQRLGDRAMLDQALERMDVVSDVGEDIVTEKSAQWIRRLLDIESDAAEGSNYSARSVHGDHNDIQDSPGNNTDGDLRLQIPYLGIIVISRDGPISRKVSPAVSGTPPDRTSHAEYSQSACMLTTPNKEHLEIPHASSANTQQQSSLIHPHQGVELSGGDPPTIGRAEVQLHHADYHQPCLLQCPGSGHDNIMLQSQVDLPSVTANVDEWAFQGVDMAFFDSLMRGPACPHDASLDH